VNSADVGASDVRMICLTWCTPEVHCPRRILARRLPRPSVQTSAAARPVLSRAFRQTAHILRWSARFRWPRQGLRNQSTRLVPRVCDRAIGLVLGVARDVECITLQLLGASTASSRSQDRMPVKSHWSALEDRNSCQRSRHARPELLPTNTCRPTTEGWTRRPAQFGFPP
jgi:hypothetical protein